MPKIELTHVTKRWDKFYAVFRASRSILGSSSFTLVRPKEMFWYARARGAPSLTTLPT